MSRTPTVEVVPAKELSDEQKADARRLKAYFKAWQAGQRAQGRSCTQEEVADEFGFKTQSAVSQYLGGGIPLNPEALMKFCTLMGVSPSAISPSIVEAETARAQQWFKNVQILPRAETQTGGLRKTAKQKKRPLPHKLGRG